MIDLINLNNVDPKNLQINQVLLIPNNLGDNPSNVLNYVVQKGDSLYSIAKKYNTTVQEISNYNNLKSNTLQIGQILKIPEKYSNISNVVPNYINYTVKKGDSLYSLSKKYNVPIETIKKDNSLESNILKINQKLKIRVKDTDTTNIIECLGTDYEDENYIIYTVKSGDSLYKIANKYNTTVSSIINLNNLASTNLSINQKLKIPNNASSITTYTVKKGDSLYSIAKKYNTTVDAIKNNNNLSTNTLSIGQVLKIF